MSIFVVVQDDARGPEGVLADKVKNFPHYEVGEGVWLIAVEGTAHEVCDKLGISGGQTGTGVVTEVGSYYGRANPAIWTWLKANWGRKAVG